MIKIVDKKDCCGCQACADICPKKAIKFVVDNEGFRYPDVDELKCCNCGLCNKVCPMIHVTELKDDKSAHEPDAFAAISRNIETRYDSTSGGLFSELANRIFEQGGFVGGAIWGDCFEIKQIVTDKKDDLPKLRSSKYAQSDAQGFYIAVKQALKTDKNVLVCGTPCQMSALRLFLGEDHANLYIVDFICRGSNSPLIMRKYIEYMQEKHGSKVIAIKMKSKELGWRRLTTKFTFEDGSVEYDPRERSLYMLGYLQSNAFCRASCYQCKFKGFPRIADISLGDCWHVADSLDGSLDDNGGTSIVLCNTEKGRSLFSEIDARIKYQKAELSEVIKGNKMLVESLPSPSVPREVIYKRINEQGFHQTMMSLLKKDKPIHHSFISYVRRAVARLKQCRKNLFQCIRINGLHRFVFGSHIIHSKGRVCFEMRNRAELDVRGESYLGVSLYKTSELESRVLISEDAKLVLNGARISQGCDIQLFPGAHLEIGENFYSNIGLEISCAQSIKIGRDVLFGRYVLIRDTNGGHVIASNSFKKKAPVVIEDHVWLCDGCSILPGVKIGSGSIVAAKALVIEDVPPNCLVAGIPAKVVREDILWKA